MTNAEVNALTLEQWKQKYKPAKCTELRGRAEVSVLSQSSRAIIDLYNLTDYRAGQQEGNYLTLYPVNKS